MSAARYFGAGLRLVGAGCLAHALLHLIVLSSFAIYWTMTADTEWTPDVRRAVWLFSGGAVVLLVAARLLHAQWHWLARRLMPRAAGGPLRRGPVRAILMGAIAATGLVHGITTLVEAAQATGDAGPGIGYQRVVYTLVIYGLVFAGGLRAALVGVRGGARGTDDDEILAPRGLEAAGLVVLGILLFLQCALLIARAVGDWLGDEHVGEPVAYILGTVIAVAAVAALGVLCVRRGLRVRDRVRVPLRLAAAALGLALLLRLAGPGAEALAAALHGGSQLEIGRSLTFAPQAFPRLLGGLPSTPGLCIQAALVLALLAYARFGPRDAGLAEAFE